MTCNHCHTWNFRDYRYCRHCGTKLDPQSAAGAGGDQEAEEVERLLEQAFAHLDQGNVDEALAAVQAALALQPGSASAHSVLGGIYERQGQIPEAIQQYEFALQLNPESQADREKLAVLAPRPGAAPARRANATQVAVIAAVTAGVAVFATGVALLLNPDLRPGNREPEPLSSARQTPAPASLTPAFSAQTAAPLTAAPLTSAPQTLPPPFVQSPPAMATAPQPTAQPVLKSGPSYPSPLPAATPGPTASTGLAPAAIGEVVPLQLPGPPSPAPGLPASPGDVAQRMAAGLQGGPQPVSPGQPQYPVGQSAPQAPGNAAPAERKTSAVELSEQPAGFIKIEVLGQPAPGAPGARPAGAPAAPKKPSAPPSISVEIGK